jgi:hypothetical protein
MNISEDMSHDIDDYENDVVLPVKCFLESIAKLKNGTLEISDLSKY